MNPKKRKRGTPLPSFLSEAPKVLRGILIAAVSLSGCDLPNASF